MSDRKIKIYKLIAISIISIAAFIACGFIFKVQVLDQRLSKVNFWRDTPEELIDISWPGTGTEEALAWLEETDRQFARQISSLKIDAKNSTDTNLTFELNNLLENQKRLKLQTAYVKHIYNQEQETLKNMPSFLSQVHKHNQSFKAELLVKYPRHEQDFEQIIKTIESTPVHIDKRILGMRFLSKNEVYVATGHWSKAKNYSGYKLLLVNEDNKWHADKSGWSPKIGLLFGIDEELSKITM